MHTLNRLQDWLLRRELAAATTTRPVGLDQPRATEDRWWSCGWYDSSHELVSGLQVRELGTPESLATELPWAAWIEVQLAACSRAPRA